MLFIILFLIGCGSNKDTSGSDFPLMITLYDRDYVAPYMPVNELPDGYEYIVELAEEQANDTGLAGGKMYAIIERDSLSDFYVYQECGTPIDESTIQKKCQKVVEDLILVFRHSILSKAGAISFLYIRVVEKSTILF